MDSDGVLHLVPVVTDRGFAHLPAIPGGDESSGQVLVYESSSATGPYVWLDVTKPKHGTGGPIHLTAENAWRLAEQLQHLVRSHYQGDATPDWAKGVIDG